MEGLREVCDEHGIVLIFDEVQTGFGRTGAWGACEHYGVTPDISTWAKALGGGMPIAAVLGKGEIMDRAAPGTLGGTFVGNPVSCAAALATIERMRELDLNARARRIGQTIRARFESIAAQCSMVTDVRGIGAMMAMELCVDGDPDRPASAEVGKIVQACLGRGLLIIPAGVQGNVIRTLTPLVITEEQLGRGLDILESCVLEQAGVSRRLSGQAGGPELCVPTRSPVCS